MQDIKEFFLSIMIPLLLIVLMIGLVIGFVPGCTYMAHKYERFSSQQKLKTYEFTELSSIKMKEIEGKKALSEAEWNKKIQIADAYAKRDASVALAQVEIERARGVAEANKIIGESLKNNEGYLRYLWIQGLQNQTNSTIYVPTEAGLPILEANRLNKQKVVQNDI